MRYTEEDLRPPQEACSLLVRGTQGCTYNDCHFCCLSRAHAFMTAPREEIAESLRSQKAEYPADTKIFFMGSNPFSLPVRMLKDWFALCRKEIPDFSEISMQSRVADIAGKTDQELKELQAAGLAQLYIGVESGSDRILALINKGQTAAQTVTQLLRLDEAGIAYTTYYIFGLGGKGAGQEAGEAGAELFNQVKPRCITSSGMTVYPTTPLYGMLRRGSYTEAPEREKIEEMYVLFSRLVSDTFYDGVHYLNPLNYSFAVRDTEARNRVLADIRHVLATNTDRQLERRVNRRWITLPIVAD